MAFEPVADFQDRQGEGWHRSPSEQPIKDRFEPGNDKNQQQRENARRHGQHGHRIEHGGLDFAFDLQCLLHELRLTPQHHLQNAARFPCLDHVDVEPAEHPGMRRQGLGQGSAASTAPATSVMTRFNVRFSSCSCSRRKPRRRGMPTSTSVANWRVNTARTAGLIPPPNIGIGNRKILRAASDCGRGRAGVAGRTLVGSKPISRIRFNASLWSMTSSMPWLLNPPASTAS